MTAPDYPKATWWGPQRQREYELEMIAAMIERADDPLVDGFTGGGYTEAHQIIELLLGQLGYELDISEDGDVAIVSKERDPDGPCKVILPDNYRVARVDGTWVHSQYALNKMREEQSS
jgi:hypothetical protein